MWDYSCIKATIINRNEADEQIFIIASAKCVKMMFLPVKIVIRIAIINNRINIIDVKNLENALEK